MAFPPIIVRIILFLMYIILYVFRNSSGENAPSRRGREGRGAPRRGGRGAHSYWAESSGKG